MYEVTVTDENGCTNSSAFELTPPMDALDITASVITEISCGQNATLGEVGVVVQNAPANIEIVWTDENEMVVGNTATVSDLGQGTYTVTVSAQGSECMSVAEVTLEAAGEFVVDDVTIVQPACVGSMNGDINFGPITDVPNPSFEWSHDNLLTVGNAINLNPGTYDVTITNDDTGCSIEQSFELIAQSALTVMVGNITPTSCAGGNDGGATVIVSGSPFGSIDFSFEWSNPVNNGVATTGSATDLNAGENFVVVYDNDPQGGVCASDTVFFNVPAPDSIMVTETLTSPSCVGEEDGMISVFASGGTESGEYTYLWSDNTTADVVMNLASGMTSLTITDDNNCAANFDFILEEPDSLFLNINPNATINSSCLGTDGATIVVTPTGGDNTYSFQWTPNVSTTDIATNLTEGIYTIVVTDGNGCTATTSYEIMESTPLVADLITPDPILCNSGSTQLCMGVVSGGTGVGYTYAVNNGFNLPIDSCLTVFTGDYTISVADSDGCKIENPIEIFIDQPAPLEVSLGDDFTLNIGDTVAINPTIVSDFAIDSLSWSSTQEEFECIDIDCESINIYNSVPTFYDLLVTDENGCTGEDQVFVEVKAIRNVFIPNIINMESRGDNFVPYMGEGVIQVDLLHIYDRWGNLLFSQEEIKKGEESFSGWDATASGQKVNPGVYVYFAIISFTDGETLEYKGSITVIE